MVSRYHIKQTVDFEGIVEADSKDEAIKNFIQEREYLFYDGVVEESARKLEPIECPNHNGSFDCTSFCDICEGEQEYYEEV